MTSEQFTWTTSSYSSNRGGDCVEVGWRTSSYSVSNGGQCVEVGWQTSSHSVSNGGDCVEVAHHTAPTPTYALRDSKHRDRGHLTFPHPEWAAFVRAVRDGEL